MEFEFYHISFVFIYISNMFPFKIIKIYSHDAINVIRGERSQKTTFVWMLRHSYIRVYVPAPPRNPTNTDTHERTR